MRGSALPKAAMLSKQLVPAPFQVPPDPPQVMLVVTKQKPDAVQQAPVGWGQLAEAHVDPTPRNTPFRAVHCPELTFAEQVPSGRQQAPSGQVLLAPHTVPPP